MYFLATSIAVLDQNQSPWARLTIFHALNVPPVPQAKTPM
jgi:hypothetical protein